MKYFTKLSEKNIPSREELRDSYIKYLQDVGAYDPKRSARRIALGTSIGALVGGFPATLPRFDCGPVAFLSAAGSGALTGAGVGVASALLPRGAARKRLEMENFVSPADYVYDEYDKALYADKQRYAKKLNKLYKKYNKSSGK